MQTITLHDIQNKKKALSPERTLTLEAEAPGLGVQFRRVFRVPRDASMDAVDATLEHGLLRVRVPRQASESGKRIEVTAR